MTNQGPNLEGIGIPSRECNLVRRELRHQVTRIQRIIDRKPGEAYGSFSHHVKDIWNNLEFWARMCGAISENKFTYDYTPYTRITFKNRHELSWFLLDRYAKSTDDDEHFILYALFDNNESVKVVVDNDKPFVIAYLHAGMAITQFHYMHKTPHPPTAGGWVTPY